MKHLCIGNVDDRHFTLGKIYEDSLFVPKNHDGCWILDDTGTAAYFSKSKNGNLQVRYYYRYFEDLTSYIRDIKINTLIDG
jgi:hypothetical protein